MEREGGVDQRLDARTLKHALQRELSRCCPMRERESAFNTRTTSDKHEASF
jgi:hypothetical protein